jgi:two-component system response regulator FixJ
LSKSAEDTVFIVDDDDAVRDSLTALFEAAGFAVRSYASGRSFLESGGSSGTGCLLLDVNMPDMDGIEVLRRLADANNENLGVIIITGHGDIPMAVQAIKAGAADFVEKPFDDKAIIECVRQVFSQGIAARSNAAANDVDVCRIASLTPREREVLEQLVIGRPNKIIGFELGISPRTVEIHRARVMQKMEAKSLSHLVRIALAAGVDPGSP